MHKQLKAERMAKKITQEEAAKVIDLSRQSYGLKENGSVSFTLEEAIKISVLLEVPLNRLFPDFFEIDSDKNAQ